MERRTISTIGAGPGGLAVAMLLANKGYDVTIYEKQGYVGGRTSEIKLGDYRFDMGPTFLNMLYLVEEVFELTNRNLADYVTFMDLDPMYELIFHNKKLKMTRDSKEMVRQISTLFPGNEEGYKRFLVDTQKKMEKLAPVLQAPMNRFTDMLKPKVIKAAGELEIGKSLIDTLSKFYKDPDLQIAFTFQSKYLGMSPWESPGAFSILSYIEHAYGVYHIEGGINQLTKAMAKVCEELGVKIELNSEVQKIVTKDKAIDGFYLKNGRFIQSDEYIINGDFAHIMTNVMEPNVLKKYTPETLEKKRYSCSTFMLYLGVKKRFDLAHHTIWFAKDYKKNVEEITKHKLLSDDPSLYIQNAVATDTTVAPKGKSTLYVLVPVPNNTSNIDWDEATPKLRELVLEMLSDRLGVERLEDYIEVEKIISPKEWEQEIGVYKGATFNLGHQLTQMLAFRPRNKFEELEKCWLVGGGTHPGSGLPIILESARITANGILKQNGEKLYSIKPLPHVEHLFETPQTVKDVLPI